MNGEMLVFLLRLGVALFGLVLIGRLLRTAHAYLSWRAFAFYGLAVAAFPLLGLLRLSAFSMPGNIVLRQVAEVVFIVGLAGSLWEHVRADQQRHRDAQRLLERWRSLTGLAETRAREVEVLSAITSKLVSSLDLRQVLQAVVDQVLVLGQADSVTVYVRDPDTGELDHHGVTAVSDVQPRPGLPPPRPAGLTATVARTGEAAFIDNAQESPYFQNSVYPALQAIASLPLRLEAASSA